MINLSIYLLSEIKSMDKIHFTQVIGKARDHAP